MTGIKKLYNLFLEMEDDLALFDFEIGGLIIWERIRSPVFLQIFQETTTGKEKPSGRFSRSKKLRFYLSSLISIRRSPLLSRKKDILIVGSQRRLLRNDGLWWDIYADPLVNSLEHSYVVIENNMTLEHNKPAKTRNLKYFDFIDFLAYIKQKIAGKNLVFTESELTSIKELREEVKRRFEIDINLQHIIGMILSRNKTLFPLYVHMLKRIRPKIVLVVCSYGKETFIEACRQVGIPVAELQHGVISSYHPGYSYPGERKKVTFPDFLLTWGNYWQNVADYPIDDSQIISVGYPFIEDERSQYSTEKQKKILFISQDRIGDIISKFAVELSKNKTHDYHVIYKLHPLEIDDWKTRYPWLIDADIEVIDTKEMTLYQLFAESMVQVGVFSTAIYEGLSFGLRTFLIDAPGVEYFVPLIETGVVSKVRIAEELVHALIDTDQSAEFDSEYFFKSNAIENIILFLNSQIIQHNAE